jgi:hypothetical protein
MNANISNLKSIFKGGNSITATGPFFTNPLSVNGPTVPGFTQDNLFKLNKSTSNIQQLLSAGPQKIVYQGNLAINPTGNTGTNNFITDSSKIDVEGELILPAWIKIDTIKLQDTFSIKDIPKDTGLVESIEIKLQIANGLPLQNNFQLYFEDVNSVALDSLFVGNTEIFGPATVNTNGFVTAPSVRTIKVKLTRAQYQKIASKVVRGRYVSTFKTTGATSVKIRNTDVVGVKMAARAILKLNVKL